MSGTESTQCFFSFGKIRTVSDKSLNIKMNTKKLFKYRLRNLSKILCQLSNSYHQLTT